jgi:hypothetical protein
VGQLTWHTAYRSGILQNERLYPLIGFLIWPFGIAIEAFRQWDRPWAKNAFWLFCIFFAFTFIIAEEGGADSARYAEEFIEFAHTDMKFSDVSSSFYVVDADNTDILFPLIMFFLSRITDNPLFLFVVFGIIFGYFYSRNIWYILEKVDGKFTVMLLLFFVTFVLLNPIWNINGFRFAVASQIFLFGTLPYLLEGKKRSLIWSAVSVLAHFTFLFPVAVLGVFYLVKNRTNLYLIFFIVTSLIQEIDMLWFQSTFSFLPEVIFSEISNYMSVEYAEYRSLIDQELPWFLTFSDTGMRWTVYLIIFSTFLFGRETLRQRPDLKTLLSFSLLFYGFANILSQVPSGGRFLVLANTFMIPFFIIFLSTLPKVGETFIIKVFTVPLLLLFCVVNIRIGMDYCSIMTFIGNPVTVALYSDPNPLIDQIKNFL